MDRPAKIGLLAAGLGLAVLAAFPALQGTAQPSRRSFEIAAGPAAGSQYAVGELIARTVSHPPGLARCEKTDACGPPGLIVSTRSSSGTAADILAVDAGLAASALAPSHVVADAVAGRGAFRGEGRQSHVRAIAALYPETVQLVVAARSKIRSVRDLRGRRVSLGGEGSGGESAASAILAAYGVSRQSLKLRREGYEAGAGLLRQGKIDALFFLGPAPSPLVAGLVSKGYARLVAIDGKAQRRLLARNPGLMADPIPPGTYGNAAAIATVGCRVLWIVRDTAPPANVYGLVRALFHPANRAQFAASPAGRIGLDEAAKGLAAPLHPGAERFYRETGRLPGREARGR